MSEWWQDEANIRSIKDLAASCGMVVRSSKDVGEERCSTVSVSIVPSKYPKELYELACTVQKDFNDLIEAVSKDHEFLTAALGNVIKSDDFTLQVFKIYEAVRFDDEQTCRLGLHRCDYMIGLGTGDVELAGLCLRQVEINTISVSTFGLFSALGDFHHYIHSRYYPADPMLIPPNPCIQNVAKGLACAWELYGKPSAHILMVVQENERNIFDQRAVEFELWKRHKVPMVRRTLTELAREVSLGAARELMMSGMEIAVVYYRAGYAPGDYPTGKEWDVRLLMERSRATLCPCAAYHLVGTKRVQQVLARPGVLERFLADPQAVRRVRSTFAGLYGLDMGPDGDSVVKMALENPEGFVLKPQREGGGNNFYGEGLKHELTRVASSPERESYIVMEKITPPPQLGLIAKVGSDKVEPTPVIGELGILGVYLRKCDEVILNFEGGHNLRTKPTTMNEGGVAIGISCLDSPNLIPAKEFVQCFSRN